jgi:MFS family permease
MLTPTAPLGRARIGNTATFALAGVVSAVGAVRIPALSDQLSLDPGDVGLAMLALGIGAAAASQAGRVIMSRVGSYQVLRIAGPATAVLAAAPGLAGSLPWLVVAFLAFGTAFGFLDTSMNAQAATLERRTGRHLMNGAHAGWSVGAVSGGGIGALTAYAELTYTQAVVGTAVVATPIALLLVFSYLPDPPTGSERARFGRVPAVVYLVGLVTFASFLIEGSVANWSGLYLRDELRSTSTAAAFGYPMLELGMIVGRTVGDRIRLAVGSRIMLTSAG